ncbi:MAG: galactose-1-phosphate uridylyltransferase [Candidatus Omnitrophica bacterium]|nr:galactose-1-phosphate uridylyltransferase [Candidatus Omnitrophota bacterium]MBI2174439.1 galactose-1-phosphate uridylyltransferase [Candidatus Omnitrophota bacterium]MBI3009950.1 galactose-1-phosphate uridylyltransferase [Candidatus Omnitrophota bacterium]
MPELRKDPLIGRWVIIATERAKRPIDFISPHHEQMPAEECPFCEGRESHTPKEILAVRHNNGSTENQPGWSVRVIPSIKPVLRIEGQLNRRGKGMYDVMNGIGAHEVIVETPVHIANMADLPVEQIRSALGATMTRISDLEKDPRFRYALWFKNYGTIAGAGQIPHSRSQLIATPVVPLRVKEELVGTRRYFEDKERCLTCDLLSQEQEAKARVVLDSPGFVALCPFAARFPFELWIIPKRHESDFSKTSPKELDDLAGMFKQVLSRLKSVLDDPPYNCLLHTAPFRKQHSKVGYWKTIEEDYHWHIELIPRLTRVAGFEWGSGFYINPTPPEESAKYLREAVISAEPVVIPTH